MNIDQAVEKMLAPRNIYQFEDAVKALRKLTDSKKDSLILIDEIRNYLLNSGVSDIAMNFDTNTFVYREQLFAKTSFRIKLREQEIDSKKLIIGHRLLPFINPSISPEQLFFIDADDNEIPVIKETWDFMDAGIYFMFMPPYGLEHYDLDEAGNITLFAFDLSDWMAKNTYKLKDNLIISPIDYHKNIFRLEKLPSRDIAAERILNQKKDEAFLNQLTALLNLENVMLPVDLQLFETFAYSDTDLVEEPGTPLGPLISDHEAIDIYNNGSYAYLNIAENFDSFFDQALEEARFPDIENMGKAKDLDGIFREIGNSFSEAFIKGKFIQQIHDNNQIDKSEALLLLFRKGSNPFFNEVQESNFIQAFEKIAEEISKKWETKRLSLPYQRLLSKTLDLKVKLIGLLRDIDDQLEDPETFNFSMLMPLQTFEGATDQFLNMVFEESEPDPKEINILITQLDRMKEEFYTTRNFILDHI